MYGLMSDWYLRYWHLHIALYQYLELDKEDYFGHLALETVSDQTHWTHGGLPRKSVNILRLISELEGCYQLTKYMAFDEDNAIIDEMKKRYYKLYFKTSKEEKPRPRSSVVEQGFCKKLRSQVQILSGALVGELNQLVERLLCKQDVSGSSPLFSMGEYKRSVFRNSAPFTFPSGSSGRAGDC